MFDMFREHVFCICIVPLGWLIKKNCQVQYFASYHDITDITSRFSPQSAVASGESYTFVQRSPFLASI